MANYNKVILVGNLTRDPQLTYLPSQTAVVEFGMAINRTWMDQNRQKREEVCFVDIRAYGKPAETINHYMSKGRQILIEGRLNFQQWQSQDGSKRSKLLVIAENFQFLGSGPGAASEESSDASASVRPPLRNRAPQTSNYPSDAPAPDRVPSPEEDVPQEPLSEDDIPF